MNYQVPVEATRWENRVSYALAVSREGGAGYSRDRVFVGIRKSPERCLSPKGVSALHVEMKEIARRLNPTVKKQMRAGVELVDSISAR